MFGQTFLRVFRHIQSDKFVAGAVAAELIELIPNMLQSQQRRLSSG